MSGRKIKYRGKHVLDDLEVVNGLDISELAQADASVYSIPLDSLRVWDAVTTSLPSAGANDDLGLVGGTFASASPKVSANDLKAAGATTRYARFTAVVPHEYVSGETLTLRIYCGMGTTVADTSCTVDAQVYEADGSGGISADLCATAAQSMNSLTFANKDFVITPTALVAGDVLDIRVAIACTDAATGTAVEPIIGKIQLLADTKG